MSERQEQQERQEQDKNDVIQSLLSYIHMLQSEDRKKQAKINKLEDELAELNEKYGIFKKKKASKKVPKKLPKKLPKKVAKMFATKKK